MVGRAHGGPYASRVRSFAVSALGPERPGIVAAIAEVLAEHAMNVVDARGAILRGHFSVTFLVTGGDHVDAETLQRALDGVREGLGLEAAVAREVPALGDEPVPRATHVATVRSHERPGILLAVSTVLARHEATVTNLGVTRTVAGEPVLVIEVGVPDADVAAEVRERLAGIAADADAEIGWEPLSPSPAEAIHSPS